MVLAVRARKRFLIIPQASIVYATSLGGVVTIPADAGRVWCDGTLTQLEQRLDPASFFCLDHLYVINLERLAELVPWTHQHYMYRFAGERSRCVAWRRIRAVRYSSPFEAFAAR